MSTEVSSFRNMSLASAPTSMKSFHDSSVMETKSTTKSSGIISHPLASKYRRTNSISSAPPHMTSLRDRHSSYTIRRPSTSSLVKPQGPVYHGWLWKKGSNFKTWKKRFFLLQGATLTYYEQMCVISSDHYGTRLFDMPAKGGLRVVGAELSEATEFGIVVTSSSGRHLFIQAGNQESRIQWLRALQQAPRTKIANESMIIRNTHGSDLGRSTDCSSPDLRSFQSTISSSNDSDSSSASNRNSGSSIFDKRGWVQVRGMVFPAWKRKYLILQDGLLTFASSDKEQVNCGTKDEKAFYVIAVSAWNGCENAFSIRLERNKEKELYVCVENQEEVKSWMEALRRCV